MTGEDYPPISDDYIPIEAVLANARDDVLYLIIRMRSVIAGMVFELRYVYELGFYSAIRALLLSHERIIA